jgi:hypothetical protein
VNCEVCGTELPHGALFCGECGRAVGTRTARAVNPDSGMPAVTPAEPAGVPAVTPGEPAEVPAEAQVAGPIAPRDTAIIELGLLSELPELETEFDIEPGVGFAGLAASSSGNDLGDAIEQDLPPELLAEEAAHAALDSDDLVESSAVEPLPETGSRRLHQTEPEPERSPQTELEPERAVEPAVVEAVGHAKSSVSNSSSIPGLRPDPFPWGDRGSAIFSDSDEIEQTLIVPRRETGERFVLQFSTGESVTVFGSGLLGRNPVPQPTEYFDQLVSISDPGKSVSKTHLEFGQDAGSFWVSDRFSGNGSAVREPESSPRRLVAGKRYRIVRGTRVDIGEQFFVVS